MACNGQSFGSQKKISRSEMSLEIDKENIENLEVSREKCEIAL